MISGPFFCLRSPHHARVPADFSGFGSDITALRKKLRGAGCELFDSFPPYGAWFRRRFGIEHEQALELFHQTVSMKSVGKRLARLTERIVNAMRGFKEEFKAETVEMDVSLAPLPEYERMLAGLKSDDLPRFEARFKELLNVNTINEIATVSWPLRLSLKPPSAADLSDRFEAVRDWVRAIADTPQVRIEWREWNHRVQGMQRLPAAVWIDTLQDALAFIGKARQAQRFEAVWQQTAAAQPPLLAWLSRRPIQALNLADRWDRLLAVVAWLQAHPRPAVYLRQVDVPGVDSKFIETHRGVLAELLDLALPFEVIQLDATGAAQFTRRFGFLDKPVRIRFRLLDPSLLSLPGCEGLPDITLDAGSFAALTLPARRVFITENETNFLAFPPAADAIVVFGAGYGWEPLARAEWLHRCQLHYWGDIDTHGFAILDQLRGCFRGVASFLMDRATLLAHRLHWGEEPDPARHDLARLTPEETAVYDDLRFDRHQPRLRLEQERVGFGWLRDRLACIPAGALVAPPPRS